MRPPKERTPGLTNHGAARMKQRLGLKKPAQTRHIEKVLRDGLREHQLSGKDAREFRIKRMRETVDDRPVEYVLYQNDIYCFTPTGELITVLRRKHPHTRGPRRANASDPDNDDLE